MDRLIEAVRRTVEKYGMAQPGQTVLCALSGGADSVCMTHVLSRLAPVLGVRLCAAHYSHGIRPEAADGERALAQSLCDSLDIPLFCGRGAAPVYARQQGISLEEAARRLRYGFLRRAAEESGSQRIATAHHRDDSCETLLLNLARGSGTVGLGGIPPVRDGLIRPLIDVTREQIERYVRQNNLRWAQDESNFDQSIPRNLVRRTVMPALKSINARAADNMARAAELARIDGDFLLHCAHQLADSAACVRGGRVEADAQALAGAHPAVSGRAVRLLYVRAGGRESVFTLRHAQAVLALCAAANPSARISLPDGMTASRRYETLVIGRGCERAPLPCIRLEPGEPVRWGEWTLCLSPGNLADWPAAAFLSPGETEEGLFVRPRAAGDVIGLPGGHKSVKKWMIDRKIPQKDRDRTPVLCDNKKIRALFWDRAYTAEKEDKQRAVVVAARREQE